LLFPLFIVRKQITVINTVTESGGSGFVDDAQHVETSDATGSLRGGTLRISEVRGNLKEVL
jgi:hypothetical protein